MSDVVELTRLAEAARANPKDAIAWCRWAFALASAGQTDAALTALRHATPRTADAPVAISAGELFEILERPGEALRAYRRAVELEPAFVDAQIALANLLSRQGDVSGAIAALEAALEHTPDHATLEGELADALLAAGRRAEAWDHLERAIALGLSADVVRALRARIPAPSSTTATAEGKAVHEQATLMLPTLVLDAMPESGARGAQGIISDMSIFSVPELLELLLLRRASGTLTLQSNGRGATLHLCAGQLAAARLTDGASPGPGDGAPTAEVTFRQVVAVLMAVMTWSEGQAVFERSPNDAPADDPRGLIDTRHALMTAVEASDPRDRVSQPAWATSIDLFEER